MQPVKRLCLQVKLSDRLTIPANTSLGVIMTTDSTLTCRYDALHGNMRLSVHQYDQSTVSHPAVGEIIDFVNGQPFPFVVPLFFCTNEGNQHDSLAVRCVMLQQLQLTYVNKQRIDFHG